MNDMIDPIELSLAEDDKIFENWNYVDLLLQPLTRITLEHKIWCIENTNSNWTVFQGPHWDVIFFQSREDEVAFRLTFL